MKRFFVFIALFFSLEALTAQEVVNVSGEYTYVVPINISLEQAKQIALERARIQCLADHFGTIVNQSHSTVMRTVDGDSEVSHFTLGETEVKGEWLGDTKQPIYKITYDEITGSNTIYVKVFGKARAISNSKVDVSAKVLCNGVTPRHEREVLYEGDQIFLSFIAPVDGYLCVYLVDEETNAYCMLPYESNDEGSQQVEANKQHVFFSKDYARADELVDEYVMSCSHDGESNILYIIFSPTPFYKAVDRMSSTSLQQLTYEDLQEWLLSIQSKDPNLQVIRKTVVIKKLE